MTGALDGANLRTQSLIWRIRLGEVEEASVHIFSTDLTPSTFAFSTPFGVEPIIEPSASGLTPPAVPALPLTAPAAHRTVQLVCVVSAAAAAG